LIMGHTVLKVNWRRERLRALNYNK
jgi:hypothetical protein